jgi:hypothetical protein
MWCELQKSRNPNFNPYMVWRALFGCLEGAPLNTVFIKMRLSSDFETVIPFWGDKFFPAKA